MQDFAQVGYRVPHGRRLALNLMQGGSHMRKLVIAAVAGVVLAAGTTVALAASSPLGRP